MPHAATATAAPNPMTHRPRVRTASWATTRQRARSASGVMRASTRVSPPAPPHAPRVTLASTRSVSSRTARSVIQVRRARAKHRRARAATPAIIRPTWVPRPAPRARPASSRTRAAQPAATCAGRAHTRVRPGRLHATTATPAPTRQSPKAQRAQIAPLARGASSQTAAHVPGATILKRAQTIVYHARLAPTAASRAPARARIASRVTWPPAGT